jgi:hypothetical protein
VALCFAERSFGYCWVLPPREADLTGGISIINALTIAPVNSMVLVVLLLLLVSLSLWTS